MEKVTLHDVLKLRQEIGLEAVTELHADSKPIKAFSYLVENATKFIKTRLNGALAYLRSTDDESSSASLYAEYLTFARTLKYMDVKLLSMQVPEGFQGNFAEYMKRLEAAAAQSYLDFIQRMLTPFDIYVSKMINEPILLSTVTHKHNVQIKEIDSHKKALAKFFNNQKQVLQPLGKIYGRMADIEAVYHTLVNVTNMAKSQDIKDTSRRVQELNAKINILVEMITDKSNNINVSSKVLETLSTIVFELAKHVEFYAVIDSMLNSALYASKVNNLTFKTRLQQVSSESIVIEKELRRNHQRYLNGETLYYNKG